MKLGSHMSTSGGLFMAIQRGKRVDCEAVQVFVKSNMQWFGKMPTEEDVLRFSEEWKQSGIPHVFGHTGYLINVAAPDSEKRATSLKSLIQEIEIAAAYGLPFLVLHPGAHLGSGESAGIEQAVRGLDEVFTSTTGCKVRIALENTAGQGSCLGHKLEHLGEIFSRSKHQDRLGVCLDTAHFFAAGYDIRTRAGWDDAIGAISDLVGPGNLLAFHINDSKTDLGSRVDRHSHIGEGKIGADAFRHVVGDTRFKDHPACLETPKSEDLVDDARNLMLLRSLCAAPVGPKASTSPGSRAAKRKG
ncbi:MAG: deoxyribonuclease IV [Verrucomicrobiota bacterium]